MTKRGNNIIGTLFIGLVIFILIGFLIISRLKTGEESKYFNKEDQVGSKILYENIIKISEEDYPNSPDKVVSLYTDGFKLLYGDKIKDMSIVENIIDKQRILLSDEIVSSNSLEDQVNNVLININNLKEHKVKITTIELKTATYDSRDNKKAYVKVNKVDNLFQTYYYIYHLELEGDKWKITGWYNTDENYNIIEQ